MEILIKTINILLLLASILGVLGIFFGRFYFPNKFWVAIFICAIIGPFGQFYIRGGFIYFLIISLFTWAVQSFGIDGNIILLLSILASVFIMVLRFKIEEIKRVEQKS